MARCKATAKNPETDYFFSRSDELDEIEAQLKSMQHVRPRNLVQEAELIVERAHLRDDELAKTQIALSLCTVCDMRSECLEYAMAAGERYGIWGGLSPRERYHLKKQRAHDRQRAYDRPIA